MKKKVSHQREHQRKNESEGKCKCGRELSGFKTCDRCREQRKQWSERRKKEGLCSWCGKPRGEDGTSIRCRECADKMNSHTYAFAQKKTGRKIAKHKTTARQFGRVKDKLWEEIQEAVAAAGAKSLATWGLQTLLEKARREKKRREGNR